MRREDSLLFLNRQPPLTVAGILVDGFPELFRFVFDVPAQRVVEKALVSTQQERPASAGHVQDAERRLVFSPSQLGRTPPFNLLADGVLDDVFNDVSWSVVDAPALAYFRLVLNLGLVSGRQPNHLA